MQLRKLLTETKKKVMLTEWGNRQEINSARVEWVFWPQGKKIPMPQNKNYLPSSIYLVLLGDLCWPSSPCYPSWGKFLEFLLGGILHVCDKKRTAFTVKSIFSIYGVDLGTKLRSLGLPTSAFPHWAISPALKGQYLDYLPDLCE